MGNKQNRTELTEDDIRMLEANTSLPRDKILKWFNDFKSECTEGVLNKKEFIKFYRELLPESGDPEKFCEYVFKAFDTNHSNSIDFNEFLLAFSITARGDLEDRLNWAFSMYDYDDNEYIDTKELKKLLEAIYALLNVNASEENSPEDRAKRIFKQLDIDNNNKISRHEFVKGLMEDEFLRHLLTPNI